MFSCFFYHFSAFLFFNLNHNYIFFFSYFCALFLFPFLQCIPVLVPILFFSLFFLYTKIRIKTKLKKIKINNNIYFMLSLFLYRFLFPLRFLSLFRILVAGFSRCPIKAAFATRINLVTQDKSRKLQTFPAGQESLKLG